MAATQFAAYVVGDSDSVVGGHDVKAANDVETASSSSSNVKPSSASALAAQYQGLSIYERISMVYVKHTWKTFLGCWGILILLAVLAVLLKYLRVEQIGFDDWLVTGTEAVDNLDKLRGAIDFVDVTESVALPERSEDAGNFFTTEIMYRWENPAESRDFLTPRNLQDMCKIEGAILNHLDYPLFCKASTFGANGTNTICDFQRLSTSVTFYGPANEIKRSTCELLTQAEIDAVKLPLYTLLQTSDASLSPQDVVKKATVRFLVGASFAQTGLSTSFRSIIVLGAPLPGFPQKVQNSKDPQFAIYDKFLLAAEKKLFELLGVQNSMWSSGYDLPPDGYGDMVRDPPEDRTRVKLFNFALQQKQFEVLVGGDQLLAAGSVVLVGILMYIHTKSMWYTSIGLLGILLSVPASAFFYSGVFGVRYFTQIHIVIIFIIIGIGCDDVFVFVDAFRQSRLSWKSLRQVQSLEEAGQRNFYGTENAVTEVEIARMAYTWKRSMEAVLATSFTTAVAFLATAVSPVVPIAGFGYFAAIVVCLNYVLVLTMMPGMALIHSRYFANRTITQVWGCRKGPTRQERDMFTIKGVGGQQSELSPEEKLFIYGYLPLSIKHKKIFPAVMLLIHSVIFIVFVIYAVRLTTPAKEDAQFRSSHMFTEFDSEFADFSNGTAGADEKLLFAKVDLVFGVVGLDRTGYDFWVPSANRGSALFNPAFDFGAPQSQSFFLNMCDLAETYTCDLPGCTGADGLLFIPEFVDCWFRDFQTFANTTLGNTTNELYTEGTFYSTLKAWVQQPAQKRLLNTVVGFENGTSTLRFVTLPLFSSLRGMLPVNTKEPVLNLIGDFVKNVSAQSPKEMDAPFFVSFDATWTQTELGIVRGMISGLAITFPMAFVTLLFLTGNITISLFAIVTIGGVVTTVLGIVQVMGWALGIGEAIAGVMVVGLAVDYTVHVGGTYNHAKEFGLQTREERFAFATEKMGGTVFASAITTIASAIILFIAQLAFFFKMATLISLTIGLSTLFTFFFFMPLLLFFGPEGDQGEVYKYCRRAKRSSTGENSSTAMVGNESVKA